MAPKRRKFAKIVTENPKTAKEDENISKWVEAVANYIQETKPTQLNLDVRSLGKEEVKSILSLLADSQVTELSVRGNCLENSMADLAPLLTETKIRKLNVSYCKLNKEDILRLAEVLKDSQITDLVCFGSFKCKKFNLDEGHECVAHLQRSKLTKLHSDTFFELFPRPELSSFLQEFLKTSITRLHLYHLKSSDLLCLLSNLGQSSITDLSLRRIIISLEAAQELNRRLMERKIEKLSISGCLDDDTLNILVSGLLGSSVTDLNLYKNDFSSHSPLFSKLKETQIKTLNLGRNGDRNLSLYNDAFRCSLLTSLDLSSCSLSDEQGEILMESLRFSSVTKLDVCCNHLGLATVQKLAQNIKDINLTELDIGHNKLPPNGLFILGKCLEESKFTHIGVSSFNGVGRHGFNAEVANGNDLLVFLKLTKGSSISHVAMCCYPNAWNSPLACELNILINTTFTELDLRSCSIGDGDGVSNLLCYLNFSSVTHLTLSHNKITDDGAIVIAEWLKDTQIRRLDLSGNSISSQGATALALSLKDTNLQYLDLRTNIDIGSESLEFLAENVKDSFVIELDVSSYFESRVLLVDKVLRQNKIRVHKLVSTFKQIAPQTKNDEFCFNQNCDGLDVSAFLENCMCFYKTVINNPRAINILLEEKSVSLSREEIFKLVFEEFPRQFSHFIASKIEANVMEHVRILKKAEEMSLTGLVESLLLNRPVYTLDEEQGVLHPTAYKLLLKYKQPVCNLAVEPRGVIKIIEYFTQHPDVEGAQDLINLLRGANSS